MERVPPQQLLDLSLAVPMPPPPAPHPPQEAMGTVVEGGGDPTTGAAGAAATGNGSAGVPTTPMTMMLPFGASGDMGFAGGGTVMTGLEALDLPQRGAAGVIGGMGLPTGVAVAGEEAIAGGGVMGVPMQTGSDAAALPSAAEAGDGGAKKKGKKGQEQEQGPGGDGPEAGMTVDQLCEYNVAQLWHRETQAIEAIDPETTDFMKQELPLTRIKKIIKQDEEVEGTPKFMIASESPPMMGKACELFILELALRGWHMTVENKRCTVQRLDLAQAIVKDDTYDFLIDIVPRDQAIPPPKRSASAAATGTDGQGQQGQQQGNGGINGGGGGDGTSAVVYETSLEALGQYAGGFNAGADGLLVAMGGGSGGGGGDSGIDADLLALQQYYLQQRQWQQQQLQQQYPGREGQQPQQQPQQQLAQPPLPPPTVGGGEAATNFDGARLQLPPAPAPQEQQVEAPDPMLQQTFPLLPPPPPVGQG